MYTVCEQGNCTGCMACVDICSRGAIKILDEISEYNAFIQNDKCINCGACQKVCPNNAPCESKPLQKWYQGWAADEDVRRNSSSGGVAAAISRKFVEDGGYVCSCVFSEGKFSFAIADNVLELEKFRGSKYVKSNPAGIYKRLYTLLQTDRVLFIGLPCQVAAVKNYIPSKLQKKLYTIDLICHGTPSPKLLELFLNQYGYSLNKIKDIQFRTKGKFQIYNDYKELVTRGVCDRYLIAFLASLNYTKGCYSCKYAKQERVSDLTIGDSWGSELPEAEKRKGISLLLCQTEKGTFLLHESGMHLEFVDIEKALEVNRQLQMPSVAPMSRNKFFEGVAAGKSFNRVVFQCLPKQCIRQNIKKVLITLKLWGGGDDI